MNTKFTRGPWKTGAEYGQFWNVYSANGTPIALANATSPIASDLQQIERTANAALIAESPNMYKQLKEAAECISDLSQGKGGWDLEGVIQGIEALLEKARGEE